MNKKEIIDFIATRISNEHRKHRGLGEWNRVAAARIYTTLFEKGVIRVNPELTDGGGE